MKVYERTGWKKLVWILVLAIVITSVPVSFVEKADASTSYTFGPNVTGVLDGDTLTISGTGNIYHNGHTNSPIYSVRESIKNIVIKSGVTSIGHYTFQHCNNLASITIPDSVTSIGYMAFQDTYKLSSITLLGNANTTIDSTAFTNAGRDVTPKYAYAYPANTNAISAVTTAGYTVNNIRNFTFGPSVTGVLMGDTLTISGTGAMTDFTSTGSPIYSVRTTIKNVIIESGVTSVSNNAFRGCSSLASVVIPEGVTSIGNAAFYMCRSLTSVVIPESVTSIGDYAFFSCVSLSEITFPKVANATIGINAFSNAGLNVNPKYAYVLSGNTSFISAVTAAGYTPAYLLGEDVIGILNGNTVTISGTGPMTDFAAGSSPIYDVKDSIVNVIIEDGVTSVGSSVFDSCTNLKTVSLPNSLTGINSRAFTNTGITSINIPKSAQLIGTGTGGPLYYTTFLSTITVDSENPYYTVVDNVLYSKDMSTLVKYPSLRTGTLTIPQSVTSVQSASVSYAPYLDKIIIEGTSNPTISAWGGPGNYMPGLGTSVPGGTTIYTQAANTMMITAANAHGYTVEYLDTTPPVITLTPNTTSPTNQNVEIMINITDSDSGVAIKKYAEGFPAAAYFATGGLYIPSDYYSIYATRNGMWTVYAKDNAGNEVINTITISNIDKEAPQMGYSVDGSPTNQDVVITTYITDTGSGVTVKKWASGNQSKAYFSTGGTAFTESTFAVSTNNTYTVYAKDAAGNESIITIPVDTIDKVPPTAPSLSANTTSPTNQNVSVTITYSGDSTIKEYKIGNSGTWKGYNSAVSVIANNTVYARARDAAGNWSNEGSLVVSNIDKVLPVITITPVTTDPVAVMSIAVEITDAGGIAVRKFASGDRTAAYFQTGGDVFTENSITFDELIENGVYTVYAKDTAGNEAVQKITISNIDRIIRVTHPINAVWEYDPNTDTVSTTGIDITNNSVFGVDGCLAVEQVDEPGIYQIDHGTQSWLSGQPVLMWNELSTTAGLSELVLELAFIDGSNTYQSGIDLDGVPLDVFMIGVLMPPIFRLDKNSSVTYVVRPLKDTESDAYLVGKSWDRQYSFKHKLIFTFSMSDPNKPFRGGGSGDPIIPGDPV